MTELEKIETVKRLIEDLGLCTNDKFKEILEIDTTSVERKIEHDYWENLNGKYLIKNENNCVKLIHILDVKCYQKQSFFGRNWCSVLVDRISFNVHDSDIRYYNEKDHLLSTTKPNRYSDYKEIKKDEYDSILNDLNNLVESAQKIKNKIK